VSAVRDATDLVVQVSTGGAVSDSEEARLAIVDCGPDAASLSLGTVNFGDDVFLNRWGFIVALYERMQERAVVPAYPHAARSATDVMYGAKSTVAIVVTYAELAQS